MAYFRTHLEKVSRAEGHSAAGAIAYGAGQKLTDKRSGKEINFSRKRGVEPATILLPDGAPEEMRDFQGFADAVETKEKRSDSVLLKSIEISGLRQLTREQNDLLALGFAQSEFVDKHGLGVVVCPHEVKASDGAMNRHYHFYCSTRMITENGLAAKKDQWICPTNGITGGKADQALLDLRQGWEHHANEALCAAGLPDRVDSRSLKDQGIDRVAGIHIGKTVNSMEMRGIRTERRHQVETIRFNNKLLEVADVKKPESAAPGWIDYGAEWRTALAKQQYWATHQHVKDVSGTSRAEILYDGTALKAGGFFDRRDENVQRILAEREARAVRREESQTDRAIREALARGGSSSFADRAAASRTLGPSAPSI